VLKRSIYFAIAVTLLTAIAACYWAFRPLPMARSPVDISIEPQTSVRGIA
jgi:hypothetical protein